MVCNEGRAVVAWARDAGARLVRFREALAVGEDVAFGLGEEVFTTREEIAYVPLEERMAIEGFDKDTAEELRARAKDALLTQAIASEERLDATEPADDLLNMEGMDRHTAFKLASHGIVTMEDLAEQAVEDLPEIGGMDAKRAGQPILTARVAWLLSLIPIFDPTKT